MKTFGQLYKQLKSNASPHQKTDALKQFFSAESKEECTAALALFSGYKPPKCATAGQLREWACEFAQIPEWLFRESQAITGSESETVNLLLPRPDEIRERSVSEWLREIEKISKWDLDVRRKFVREAWSEMHPTQRPLFHAWITGGFRCEISSGILNTVLAEIQGLHPFQIAGCLYGQTLHAASDWAEIFAEERTYPPFEPVEFSVASQIQSYEEIESPEKDWRAFRRWDGLPVQLIYAKGRWWIWTKSGHILNAQLPEIEVVADSLPVERIWEGEILCIREEKVIPYTEWKSRVERKKNSRQQVEEFPLYFQLHPRHMNELPFTSPVLVPEEIAFSAYEDVFVAHAAAVELKDTGILFQHISDVNRLLYWQSAPEPVRIFAVLMHVELASSISGKMNPEFSFGIWNMHNTLVPIAKTRVGISEQDQKELLEFVKKNTVEKRGPVRVVSPKHVFEIEVAGLRKNTRRKSGMEALSPVILHWKRDVLAIHATHLQELQAFL